MKYGIYELHLCTALDGRLEVALVGCDQDGQVLGELVGALPADDLATVMPLLAGAGTALGPADTAADTRTYRVAEIRERFPNAYRPWSEDDDQELLRRRRAGDSTEQLSRTFGRGVGAITSRLAKLGEIPTSRSDPS